MESRQVDPHLEQSQYALDLAETVLNHAFGRHVCDGARAALIAAVLNKSHLLRHSPCQMRPHPQVTKHLIE